VFDLLTGNTLALLDNGVDVAVFDSLNVSHGVFSWTSQEFFYQTPVSFGAIMIEGEQLVTGGGFTIWTDIYADGVLFSGTGAFNAIQRIGLQLAQKWQVRITTNARITRITLANNPSEIAQG